MRFIENGLKGFILSAGIVITCTVISIGFYFARESSALSSASAENLSEFSTELYERNITMYDGLEVSGSDVINFIKRNLGDYGSTEISPLYVYVKTLSSENTYVNGGKVTNIQNFTDTMYIKPIGKFVGKLDRDENRVIIGIKFIQK